MALIKIPLAAFFETAAAPLVKRVLASLGLGIISSAGIAVALNQAIQMGQGYYSGLPQYIFALAALSGMGQGLGIIAGAIIFRVTFTATSRIGLLPK